MVWKWVGLTCSVVIPLNDICIKAGTAASEWEARMGSGWPEESGGGWGVLPILKGTYFHLQM